MWVNLHLFNLIIDQEREMNAIRAQIPAILKQPGRKTYLVGDDNQTLRKEAKDIIPSITHPIQKKISSQLFIILKIIDQNYVRYFFETRISFSMVLRNIMTFGNSLKNTKTLKSKKL